MGGIRKLEFKPRITRVKLNPEQAVLTCNCYDSIFDPSPTYSLQDKTRGVNLWYAGGFYGSGGRCIAGELKHKGTPDGNTVAGWCWEVDIYEGMS